MALDQINGIFTPDEVTALSRMNGYIGSQKHLLSELVGYDIGTPAAVQAILSGKDERIHLETRDKIKRDILDLVRENAQQQFAWHSIVGYLNGTNWNGLTSTFQDYDGQSQLEGELRRFKAKAEGTDPKQVAVDSALVDSYCAFYGLGVTAAHLFTSRLGIR